MSGRPELKIDWATHAAAKYACENWHYSRSVPKSKLVKIGVWEGGRFIGVLIFSYGATPQIGSPYGLKQTEICELTRVALDTHVWPVSKIGAIALRKLREIAPGLRLVVSFADSAEGHHGGIYQAMGWLYAGQTKPGRVGFIIKGKRVHTRTIGSMPGGVQSLEWVKNNVDPAAREWVGEPKHRYLMPLDKEMAAQIEQLRRPYPKRPTKANPSDQGGSGGAVPTRTLQVLEGDDK